MDVKVTWMRTGAVCAVCALAGAGAGLAGSAAAPTKSSSKSAARPAHPRMFGMMRGGPEHMLGRVAHAEATVLNKAGTAWITQTLDQGVVKSVSGNDVTITEGTTKVPYKDVTVTVPADATVVRNGKKAAVGDLKAGDHVHVISSSDGTTVFAGDDTFRPGARFGHMHREMRPGGPGFPGPPPGMPGPPPGAPAP